MSSPRKLVAVVVPGHDRDGLTDDERTSVRHLMHHLGRYDKYMVLPKGRSAPVPGFRVESFDGRYFGSAESNKRLLLSRHFYERFLDYRYILIYHLDALVFRDALREWCATGLDYIGAPWLRSYEHPERGFSRVGNGGFSLRRIDGLLRVFDSPRYTIHPDRYWERSHQWKPWYGRLANLPRKYLKRLHRFNGPRRDMKTFQRNEDHFWSRRAQRYHPGFRVASVDTGLRFAFERAPRYCFERNGRQLPFGCHAWPRFDRAFWEPYLLS